MRHLDRFVFTSVVSIGCLATVVVACGDRTATEILLELDANKIPRNDSPVRDDRKAIDAYYQRIQPIINLRSKLILELYQVDPDNPKLPELMNARWRSYGIDKLKKETEYENVLTHSKNPVLRSHAFFWKALEKTISAQRDPGQIEAASAAVEDFVSQDPKDPRGADLLYSFASLLKDSPARQAKVERRLIFEYPDTQWGKLITGKLRQFESRGKIFDLDFIDAIKGNHVSMKEFRGKVVVVDFWATWCGPCIEKMPELKKLYESYHKKGVEFIGVSLDHPEEMKGLVRLKAFVEKNEIPWPQYYQGNGWESEFSSSWGINSIPSVFVIDKEGKIYSTKPGEKLGMIIMELMAKDASTAISPQ